jgi:hypothetical protein
VQNMLDAEGMGEMPSVVVGVFTPQWNKSLCIMTIGVVESAWIGVLFTGCELGVMLCVVVMSIRWGTGAGVFCLCCHCCCCECGLVVDVAGSVWRRKIILRGYECMFSLCSGTFYNIF